jgi:hypothetical protein
MAAAAVAAGMIRAITARSRGTGMWTTSILFVTFRVLDVDFEFVDLLVLLLLPVAEAGAEAE